MAMLASLAKGGLSAYMPLAHQVAVAALQSADLQPQDVLEALVADNLLLVTGVEVQASAETAPWLAVLSSDVMVGLELELAVDEGDDSMAVDLFGPPGARCLLSATRLSELAGDPPDSEDDAPVLSLERITDEAAVEHVLQFLAFQEDTGP